MGLALRHAEDVLVLARNWFVNRAPVFARFPWMSCDRHEFSTQDDSIQYCQRFTRPTSDDAEDQTCQLQDMCDEIEGAILYGVGKATMGRPARMHGLRNLIPIEGVADGRFREPDLTAAIKAAKTGGGDPDLMLASTDLIESSFAGWGWELEEIECGHTCFWTNILAYEARLPGPPLRPGRPSRFPLTILHEPALDPGTLVLLTSHEILIRYMDAPRWLRRNRRKGDRWDARLAIYVVNGTHHRWIEGIRELVA